MVMTCVKDYPSSKIYK